MPEDLLKFGLIPEFVGRLPVTVTLSALTREDLMRVLTEPRNAVTRQFQKFLQLDKVDLVFTDGAIAAASELAQARKTGARALRSIVEESLLDVMYDIPERTDANTATSGPDIALNAAATEALGMVLHELVTNAFKYGALSIPEGRISVSWEYQNSGDATLGLKVLWRETCGPSVSAPCKSGYGISLICELIPHELGGSVDLAFSSEGVSCTIDIPHKQLGTRVIEPPHRSGSRATIGRKTAKNRSSLTGFCRMASTFPGCRETSV